MNYLRDFFGRLRWKLTLSYTLVTVATLLVLELCLITGTSFLVINSNILPRILISAVDFFIIPPVATFLDHPQPDVQSLEEWLQIAATQGLSFQASQNPKISLQLGDFDPNSSLVVLDKNLNWLAGIPAYNDGGNAAISESNGELLAAALKGDTDPARISQLSDDLMTIAVPVVGENENVLGIVMMVLPFPPRGSLLQLLSLIGSSLIVFTLAAGIVGAIFGYITARGLIKRLEGVSTSAESWSKGDFSTFIQDRSADEIGQLAQQLNQMAEQLQNLLRAKEELATLEERNRLARDLHDSVKQQVFATTMQVGAARAMLDQDSDAVREHLDQAEQLSRQAQAELNALISELHPVNLETRSLIKALGELLGDWSRQNEIDSEFIAHGEPHLPMEVEQAFFRITQESLANVARHSRATKVEVEVNMGNGCTSITISDNGVGFDIRSEMGEGMGLNSMQERMDAVGGELRLESKLGQGTKITAIFRDAERVK
jgi:NarL family two-component system sensor histidine kinase LiaS